MFFNDIRRVHCPVQAQAICKEKSIQAYLN